MINYLMSKLKQNEMNKTNKQEKEETEMKFGKKA
jgi:hypothetical protein